VRVAVVGGTGDFGLALAQRLVEAGDHVVVGSRDAERARAKAAEAGAAEGAANADAVRDVDLVVLAVNADAALPTAAELADAIGQTPVLSVASELRFTKAGVHPSKDERSIAERIQELVRGPVAAGLQSLAAVSLAAGKADGDALVCGDDALAKDLALELAAKVVSGRALDAGPLSSARALEGLTAVIVNLNRRYRGHAGIRIVGL
jgi:8-hydroxy-5-deazaflavin:NADPH oxidoreductase